MVGEILRAAMERLGLSQSALARQSGVSQAYINQILAGTRPKPSAEKLQMLGHVVGLTVDDLLGTALPSPRQALLESLRGEGVPTAVLADLAQVAPDLVQEDWELLVEVARRQARKNVQRAPQRRKRARTPTPSAQDADSQPERPPARARA